MIFHVRIAALASAVAISSASAPPPAAAGARRDTPATPDAVAEADRIVHELVARSFPELRRADIRCRPFHSESDYFRASFNTPRFVFGLPMRYLVLVNPAWAARGAPVDGVRAILAHELAHILDFQRGTRIRMPRLIGLASPQHRARYERSADLQAIWRGYGPGLEAYRVWLYQHVRRQALAEKRRDYFSPAEIEAILTGIDDCPDLLAYWMRHVPMRLIDIETASR